MLCLLSDAVAILQVLFGCCNIVDIIPVSGFLTCFLVCLWLFILYREIFMFCPYLAKSFLLVV